MSQGTPVAYSVPFDNSTNGFISDNVQAAIEEARSSGSTNFSYLTVGVSENITIPAGQQMLVNGHVTVLGHLTVDGDLIDISNRKPEAFFYDVITVDQCVKVSTNRLLLYKDHLTVLGHIRVQGRLAAA
jgi:phage baseplate assembly protein gpV